jgi:peptide/nickel transport system permease protein
VLPFIVKRLLNLIPVFLGATLLSFIIIQAAPGDFLDNRRLDARTTPETISRLERKFGLDQPVPVQYLIWLKNAVTGDLGTSFDFDRPVTEVILPRIGNSLVLVIGNLVLLWLISIPLGVYGAVRQYSLGDKTLSLASYFFLGFPSFFLALIVVYLLLQFKFRTGAFLLPVGNMTSPNFENLSPIQRSLDILWHAIAPIITVTIIGVAGFSRFMRAQMLDFLDQDFIRTARAKGLSERTVIYKHALRNAITPFIAGIGGLLPALVGGAGFVEIVFNWPGITPLLLASINSQDLYVFVGLTAITLVLLIVGNLASDFLLAAVDPRVQFE